jgi:plasmid stability protein
MPAVTVRNLSVETHLALKQRAAARGTSAEAEIRSILEDAVREQPRVGLGTMLRQIAEEYGGYDLDIRRDQTPLEAAIFE